VRAVFWPIDRFRNSLWPKNPTFLTAARNCITLAVALAALARLLLDFAPAVSNAMTPAGYAVEIAVLAFLAGRATGFWSADRRIQTKPNPPVENSTLVR
jgi:hypothetical protein